MKNIIIALSLFFWFISTIILLVSVVGFAGLYATNMENKYFEIPKLLIEKL